MANLNNFAHKALKILLEESQGISLPNSECKNLKQQQTNHKKKEEEEMPEVQFTKENLLERKQLKAGWRKLRVKSVDEKPGVNDPDSITWPTTFIVDEGEDLGTPVNHWFTEKQMGRLAEFIKCFTGGNVDTSKKYKLEDTVGRHVMGYVEYDIKTGFNSIKDFKPAAKSTSEAAK